mmetsp:Transcript_61459/g.114932  ORF Transcript_61459/g.114932 Transcript_61459/m.114932 type:complete len:208 (-) Transcript_61459:202-825(-)
MQHARRGVVVQVHLSVHPDDDRPGLLGFPDHGPWAARGQLGPDDEEDVAVLHPLQDRLPVEEGLVVALVKPEDFRPLADTALAANGQWLVLLILGRFRSPLNGGACTLEVCRIIQVYLEEAGPLQPLVAAHLVDAAVDLTELATIRASLQVQAIHILGDQGEALHQLLKLHKGKVARVGLGLPTDAPPVLVPLPQLLWHLVILLPGG